MSPRSRPHYEIMWVNELSHKNDLMLNDLLLNDLYNQLD